MKRNTTPSRHLRRAVIPVLAIIAGAALVGCAGEGNESNAKVGGRSLPTRSAEAGAVTVGLSPQLLDRRGVTIGVVLDTHSGDLGIDLRRAAVLTVDGSEWPFVSFTGDGPGGHHREAKLRFRSGGAVRGEMRLVITGLDERVEASWQLEDGPGSG